MQSQKLQNLKRHSIPTEIFQKIQNYEKKFNRIHHDQAQVVIAAKYIKGLNQKIETMEWNSKIDQYKNNLKILNKGNKKLENHKKKLLSQLYGQWKVITSLNTDTEFKTKLVKTAERIIYHKEQCRKLKEANKELEKDRKKVMNEYTKLTK